MLKLLRGAALAAAVIGASVAPSFAQPSPSRHLAEGAPTIQPQTAAVVDVPEETPVQPKISAESDTSGAEAGSKPQLQAQAAPEAPKSLAQLVRASSGIAIDDAEMKCLARAVYFESKGEPLSGQLAVAQVIINRAKSGRYPSSLCGVVKQPGQFSFVRGGRLPSVPEASSDWHKAVAIAHIARNALARSLAPTALAFHAAGVSPGWRLKRVALIGRHVFYR